MRANLEGAATAADALAYVQLNLDPEWFAELRRMGADSAMYDELLAQLGQDGTTESWVASGDAWFHANAVACATDDPTLIDAWVAWNEAEIGSADETVAWNALGIRLTSLLQENMMDAGPRTSDTVRTARADRN